MEYVNEVNEEIFSTLKSKLDQIISMVPESFTKEKQIKLDQGDGIEVIRLVHRIFKTIRMMPLGYFDGKIIGTINTLVDQPLSSLQALRRIVEGKEGNNPQEVWDKKVSELLRQYYQKIFPNLGFILSFANHEVDDPTKKLLRKTMEEDANRAKEKLQTILDVAEKIDTTYQNIQETTGEIAVAEHSRHFITAANDHKNKSRKWFWGVMCTTIGLPIVAYILILDPFGILPALNQFSVPQTSVTRAIQGWGIRIVTLSAVYFAMVFCNRNYRSNQHNYVVNQHRANGLKTFRSFVDAAEKDVRDAVLLQTTYSIFKPQDSGFESTKSNDKIDPNLLGIVRTFISQGAKQTST